MKKKKLHQPPAEMQDVGVVKTDIPKILTAAQKRLFRSEFGPIPELYRINLITKPARDNPYALQAKAFVERELAKLRAHRVPLPEGFKLPKNHGNAE